MKQERIPSRRECLRLLEENGVYPNIIEHSKAVAEIALEYGRKIKHNGGHVNLRLLEAASLLHDICKFKGIKGNLEEISHGKAGADLLRMKGLDEIAGIVECHVMNAILKPGRLNTWEKKLVYYADKRVNHDRRVSFDERLAYLMNRYPKGAGEFRKEEPLIRKLEKEIFEKAGVKS